MGSLARPAAWLLAAALPWSAAAQTGGGDAGSGLGQQLPPAIPARSSAQGDAAPAVEHLLGDPDGMRADLRNRGIDLLLDATTEFAGNASGGTRRGATFANQVGFEADIDWQRLVGIIGLSTRAIIVNRSGSSDSHLFGDNLLPVQEIYGSGGNVAFHLVSVYVQETLFDQGLDMAAGRMNVENDFASSTLYCGFMNNGLCGDPKALPGGDIGHSAYPDAVWAGRIRMRPTAGTYVQIGIYEVNQGLYGDQNFRSGFKFDVSQDSGVYVPIEFAYEPLLGTAGMPGHYKIGFGYDSSALYKSFVSTLSATSGTAPGMPISKRRGNTQSWVLVDQMLLRQGPSDTDGIVVLGGFVHNDPNNSPYAEQYFTALLDRGFWRARPQDVAGLLFTYNTVSGVLGKVQAQEAELGVPFSNMATGPQSREMVLEANYDIHVTRGVSLQPDFQYVFRPDAQSNIHDAAVFGFKAHVEL